MPVDVKTSLPQITVQPGDTLTVTLDDPGAVILSLTVHGYETAPGTSPPELPPLLSYSPSNV